MNITQFEQYNKNVFNIATEITSWLICDLITHRFNSAAEYVSAFKDFKSPKVDEQAKKKGNLALSIFSNLFHLDWQVLEACLGPSKIKDPENLGEYCHVPAVTIGNMNDFASSRSEKQKIWHYKKKNTKKFNHLSFSILNPDFAKLAFAQDWSKPEAALEAFLGHKPLEASIFAVRKILMPYARLKLMKPDTLRQTIMDDTAMTKEEKEKLKKECFEGKHAFPYAYLVKCIEKAEAQKMSKLKKHQKKALLKLVPEIKADIKKLEDENKALKEDNKALREQKDTDIASEREEALIKKLEASENRVKELEEAVRKLAKMVKSLKIEQKMPKKLSYGELTTRYPDGVPDETLDSDDFWESLTDECKAQLKAESEEDRARTAWVDESLSEETILTGQEAAKSESEALLDALGFNDDDFNNERKDMEKEEASCEAMSRDMRMKLELEPKAKPIVEQKSTSSSFPIDNSDIPEDELGHAEVQKKLQSFIDKKYVGYSEMKNLVSYMPFNIDLTPAKDGFTALDRESHVPERATICNYLSATYPVFTENKDAAIAFKLFTESIHNDYMRLYPQKAA